MDTLIVTQYPKNADHVRKLMGFCGKVLATCGELGVEPVLGGSMAVFAYTNDQNMEVRDLDLSCTEEVFPALLDALESHSMSANVTSWHVLQVRDKSLKIEFDSVETWMADMNLVPRRLDLYGLTLHIIDRESLLELYRRGMEALKGTSDPSTERKLRKLTSTYSTLQLIAPPQ